MVRLALLLTLHSAVALAAALVSWLVSTTPLDEPPDRVRVPLPSPRGRNSEFVQRARDGVH